MSLHATVPVDASADVSLRVPRGGTEDLESGVAAVIEGVDGVTAVTVDRVTSVRPTFTDIRVDADVSITIALPADADPEADVAERLPDGFGITSVNDLVVEEA
ncbi:MULTISPECIES: hypothetical protein [Haloarcula]|uniref:Uncharacterized protein n=1 Tax=Haloarcula pellucida TaxID=1427151 RepID=A0A830GJE6_9EURY|nr:MULTISPECIES: hypothetical protein [Halomicroarcula]MBX0347866.1 hypothetical protein [Halomicroarcula pellucida]MDS0276200.1 hypothetical protein [Halomicroarcula sp. S1AR25-4]GGN90656.1 hypothetical protein GCM10009030_12910 [Halomicroarcula pellucida]